MADWLRATGFHIPIQTNGIERADAIHLRLNAARPYGEETAVTPKQNEIEGAQPVADVSCENCTMWTRDPDHGGPLGGSVLIETIFSWAGTGNCFHSSLFAAEMMPS